MSHQFFCHNLKSAQVGRQNPTALGFDMWADFVKSYNIGLQTVKHYTKK